MKKYILFAFFISIGSFAYAQFDPQVGYGSNNAVHKDSSVIKSWATSCTLALGKQDISSPNSPLASFGNESNAIGKGGTGVVSLGDGGSAILTFAKPIINGSGADFAVYENGFSIQDAGNAFLELAYVEVSSDGIQYFRFPAISNTDTTSQIESYGTMNASKLNNLAGKYIANYGTPFDLDELKTIAGLDVDHITHVKIVDVVGSINDEYATRDSRGTKVNDPWPTPVASSGFDLDAVGVINEGVATSVSEGLAEKVSVYPNPISIGEMLSIDSKSHISNLKLIDTYGITKVVAKNETDDLLIENIHAGVYFLQFIISDQFFYEKVVVK